MKLCPECDPQAQLAKICGATSALDCQDYSVCPHAYDIDACNAASAAGRADDSMHDARYNRERTDSCTFDDEPAYIGEDAL